VVTLEHVLADDVFSTVARVAIRVVVRCPLVRSVFAKLLFVGWRQPQVELLVDLTLVDIDVLEEPTIVLLPSLRIIHIDGVAHFMCKAQLLALMQ